MKKRLRMFAGPNGSGKSTFIKKFPASNNLTLGVYVNADDIEASLEKSRLLQLKEFGIELTTTQVQEYFRLSQFAPVKLSNPGLWKSFSISDDALHIDNSELSINSYIAADIAELIRQQLA